MVFLVFMSLLFNVSVKNVELLKQLNCPTVGLIEIFLSHLLKRHFRFPR